MEMKNETGHVNRKLLAKHLESVVSFRVWKQLEVAEKREGVQEQEGQHKGNEDEKDKAGQCQTVVYYGTGFIIHSSDNFVLVLSCAHTFAPFYKHGAAALDDDIRLAVDFSDQYSTVGHVSQINLAYDLSIVVVFLDGSKRGSYRSVKFTENSCPLMGFSVSERDATLHSIMCFPADQEQALFGTAVSGSICGPPRLGQDVDPKLHSELKMVQFHMSGADGCSGAPLFTQNLFVMGIWTSHVGDIKFGVVVDSICEWLRKTCNIKETSMKTVVAKIGLLYSQNIALIDRMKS